MEEVLIPRIESKRQNEQFIGWNQRQFPVRPAFAMTINKIHGQTHKKVGVWLEEPTFTHGQLYVAASIVADPQHLLFAVSNGVSRKTRNVVYNEILLSRLGGVYSNWCAVNMFIAEFRPIQGCNWFVALYDTIALPGFWHEQCDDPEDAVVRQLEIITWEK